ncbi:hypothetical protein KC867_01280 [Candidatus Saccharibacteria bacterium]|nr:hypothetical protein [Candidatus Saccharibacteria bacterium]
MNPDAQNKQQIIKALTPTKSELIIIPLLSFLVVGFFALMEYFQAIDGKNYEIVANNIEDYIRSTLATLDQLLGVTLLTLIFWMFIGTLVYSIIWTAISAYSTYKDDLLDTESLVFPRGYQKSKVISEGIAKIALRTTATILLLFWIFTFLTQILPMAMNGSVTSEHTNLPSTATSMLVSIATLSISIFVSFVLVRFMLLRTRIFR